MQIGVSCAHRLERWPTLFQDTVPRVSAPRLFELDQSLEEVDVPLDARSFLNRATRQNTRSAGAGCTNRRGHLRFTTSLLTKVRRLLPLRSAVQHAPCHGLQQGRDGVHGCLVLTCPFDLHFTTANASTKMRGAQRGSWSCTLSETRQRHKVSTHHGDERSPKWHEADDPVPA